MKIYRDAWIIVVVAGVLALALELSGRALARSEEHQPLTHPVIERQEWGPQYLRDLAPYRWRHDHHAYVEFRESPYASATINIGAGGVRMTPGSCESPKPDAIVFMFGGSTMLGVGVPDRFTVPAYFARLANTGGRCVRVVNYGAGWWQSSQSLTLLTDLLRHGARPDVVVFYDGINDIDVVTYGGTPGGIAPDAAVLLNLGIHNDLVNVKRAVLQNSGSLWLATRFLLPRSKGISTALVSRAPEDASRRADEIVQVYRGNLMVLEALERQFGFVGYAIWQPFPLIARKTLTPAEQQVFATRLKEKPWEPAFVSSVYERIRSDAYLAARPRFRDLSAIFDGETQEQFVDVEHLLPAGNDRVAARLAEIVWH